MRSRISRAIPLAILALGAAVTAADASTLSAVVTTFRATANPVTFESIGASVRCGLTLEGSLTEHTFSKTVGARIGSVSRASAASCTGGTARVLTATLPWSVQYSSFNGTLPDITGTTLRLVGASFEVTPSGFPTCLARTTAEEPLGTILEREGSGDVGGIRFDERASIRITGEAFCIGSGHIGGTGNIKREGEETNGLVLLLGTEGADLEGATAEERGGADGIAGIIMERNRSTESRGIRNIGRWYENRVKLIRTIGGNWERFEIPGGEMNACVGERPAGAENGTRLLPGGGSCNVRVRVDTGTRPLETEVEITYNYGIFINTIYTERFRVRAENR